MSRLALVLEKRDDGVEAALIEDDRLVDLLRTATAGELGDGLHAGRITRIDRHLGGAFVDIGASAGEAFILARDARFALPALDGGEGVKRNRAAGLAEGQRLIVQGRREAEGDKGPRVTAAVQLRGRFLALQPHANELALSPRLKGRAREEMAGRCAGLGIDAGFVVRRLAVAVDDDALKAEALELRGWWERSGKAGLAKGAATGPLGGMIDPFETLVWQLLDHRIDEIAIADDGLFVRCTRMLERLPESERPELIRLEAQGSAFAQTGVDDEIGRALARELELAGGGRIIIEHAAACIAIDVDGGGRAALDVDLEAAAEIGRQMRLRNLGGTIIVDFVDLPTRPQRQRLEEALRRSVRGDAAPVQIFPMSPLGIVQMSRARRGSNRLAERLANCPHCGGTGKVAR